MSLMMVYSCSLIPTKQVEVITKPLERTIVQPILPREIDLPNKSLSGLKRSKEILEHLNEISIVDFDHTDVVRHPLVSKIVKAYSDQNFKK